MSYNSRTPFLALPLGSAVPATQLIVLCFAGVVCVGPLAIYLCWLAGVNRRPAPTVVAGAWDFARLYAALSGFVLVGGVVLLSLVQTDSRFVARGDWAQLQVNWEQERVNWTLTMVGYLTLVIGVAALVAASRARLLCVYNVAPADADKAVEEALEKAGLPTVRHGNRWGDGIPLVEVVPFHGTAHVGIHLLSNSRATRDELERHLRPALLALAAPDNPAAPWLTSLASGTVMVLVGFVLFGVYLTLTR